MLIKPLIVEYGHLNVRHAIIPPLKYASLEDIPANLTIQYCEMQIDEYTGKSSVCPHKLYARWDRLPPKELKDINNG